MCEIRLGNKITEIQRLRIGKISLCIQPTFLINETYNNWQAKMLSFSILAT